MLKRRSQIQDVKLNQQRTLLELLTNMPDEPHGMYFTKSAVIAVGMMMSIMLIFPLNKSLRN